MDTTRTIQTQINDKPLKITATLLSPDAQLYRLITTEDIGFKPESVDAMLVIPDDADNGMVFRIDTYVGPREVIGTRLDPMAVINMMTRELQDAQAITRLHLAAFRKISNALNNPFKGDTTKTVMDLAEMASNSIALSRSFVATTGASTIVDS